MESEVQEVQENKLSKQDEIENRAMLAIADIITSGERMLGAMEILKKLGTKLYVRQFKHSTKSYKKKCLDQVNHYYDLTDTLGAGTNVLANIRATGAMERMIADLSGEQRNMVMNFINDNILSVNPEVETVDPIEEEEAVQEEVQDNVQQMDEIIRDEIQEEDFEATMKEGFEELPMEEESLVDVSNEFSNTVEKEISQEDGFEQEEVLFDLSLEQVEKIQEAHAASGTADSFEQFLADVAYKSAGLSADDYKFTVGTTNEGVRFLFKLK